MTEPKKGDLQIWWIPQVPMKTFDVPVKNLREARLVLDTLAKYDLFQLENNIKPDFCNAGGLQVFDPSTIEDEMDGWVDWYDEKDGEDFDDYCRSHPKEVA